MHLPSKFILVDAVTGAVTWWGENRNPDREWDLLPPYTLAADGVSVGQFSGDISDIVIDLGHADITHEDFVELSHSLHTLRVRSDKTMPSGIKFTQIVSEGTTEVEVDHGIETRRKARQALRAAAAEP